MWSGGKMLKVNWEDVWNVLKSCQQYLVVFIIVFIIAIVASLICYKKKKIYWRFVCHESIICVLLAFVVTVNLICFNPLSTLLTLVTSSGSVSEESSNEALELIEDIAEEGIVMLENRESTLPLEKNIKLNVFGWASTNPSYGGTGSGAFSEAYSRVSLLDGLERAGFEVNQELVDFYTDYETERPVIEVASQEWDLPEPPTETYGEDLIQNAKDFSDTAVVVIGRAGGEGADFPTNMDEVTYKDNSTEYRDFPTGTHYLELNQTEKDMLDLVCNNFEDVVLIYNAANSFEMGFLEEYAQIKGVLWCQGAGQNGFEALGKILNGEVNPSGKTTDTFVTDLTSSPTFYNFGDFKYTNMDEFITNYNGKTKIPSFVNYVEGIYVGYRFYETAAEEKLIDYDKAVIYPFGYGMSYTEFSQKMGKMNVDKNGTISFDVTVTNQGNVSGRDVVEVYYCPPYINGGTEKSSVNLIAFDKTDILKPGESQKLAIKFSEEEMASFDETEHGCYVLEKGEYNISIRSDSHTVIEEQTYKKKETEIFGENNKRATDLETAVCRFGEMNGGINYLSRKDGFANFDEATAAPANNDMPKNYKDKFINNSNYNPKDYNNDSDEMPVTGAKNGMVLADLRGKAYEDPAWEELLDQMTVKEMQELIALGGFQTRPIKSVGKITTIDCDGTSAINNTFTKEYTVGFPVTVMLACSWNERLSFEYGRTMGKMADEMKVSGWYGPSMNIHRSQFGGRNFEYYSEDGILTAVMAAQAVMGAKEYGVYTFTKHFALNDQDTNRSSMICTWSNEQAMREIYFKPFESVVKEAGTTAMMSSFNYLGGKWSGGTDTLLNSVLRGEWGFQGMVLSDWFGNYGYQNADQAIRNGNDICLTNLDVESNFVQDTTSATSVKAMRHSCKNIMYTIVNSRAYADKNYTGSVTPVWQKVVAGIDIGIAALLIMLEVLIVKRYRKEKENSFG